MIQSNQVAGLADLAEAAHGNDTLRGAAGDIAPTNQSSDDSDGGGRSLCADTPIRGMPRWRSQRDIRRLANAANDGTGSQRIAA